MRPSLEKHLLNLAESSRLTRTGRLEKIGRSTTGLTNGTISEANSSSAECTKDSVIMVAALHRFYGGDTHLRADADLLLVRNTGTPGMFDASKVERMLGPVVYYAMRQHEVDALRDRKELAWTAYVAETGSGVFRVSRPPVSKKWLLCNVGSSETSEETAVELVEPGRKSELSEPTKKSAVEEKITIQTKPHRAKWGRRFVIATGVLAALYLACISGPSSLCGSISSS